MLIIQGQFLRTVMADTMASRVSDFYGGVQEFVPINTGYIVLCQMQLAPRISNWLHIIAIYPNAF